MAESETNEGVQYLKSIPSILKISEIILLIVCIGSVGYFLDQGAEGDYDKKDNLKFFVGAAAVAAIIALLFFLVFLTGLNKKVDTFNWSKTAAGVFLGLAVLLLIASALLADSDKYYHDKKVCKILDLFESKNQCKQLTTGAVCGFIAMVVFIVDGIIHFKM